MLIRVRGVGRGLLGWIRVIIWIVKCSSKGWIRKMTTHKASQKRYASPSLS